jgi:hypothetical protein
MQDDNNIPDASIQAAMQSDDLSNNNPAPVAQDGQNEWGHPGTPVADTPVAPTPEAPAPEATMPAPAPEMPTAPAVNPVSEMNTGTLADLKQKAIGDLSPLLQHLDQTPEDKFRTTMMMIQATDDQSLLGAAHAAANAIPDEKAKAQALLDVINEVNYFTQSGHQPQ